MYIVVTLGGDEYERERERDNPKKKKEKRWELEVLDQDL
jgi:hypothetical protein